MIEAPFFIIIGTVICIVINVIMFRKNFNMKAIIYLTFSLYLIYLTTYIFFPIPFQKLQIETLKEYNNNLNHTFIPFNDFLELIKEGYNNFFKFISKRIILFIPLGFYIPLIFKKASKLTTSIYLGGLISFIFEFFKIIIGMILGVKYKIASVDMALLYIIGSTVGTFLFFYIRKTLDNYISLSDYTYKIRGN